MDRCPYCGELRSLVLVKDALTRYPQYVGYLPPGGSLLVCPKCGVILSKAGGALYSRGLSSPGHP